MSLRLHMILDFLPVDKDIMTIIAHVNPVNYILFCFCCFSASSSATNSATVLLFSPFQLVYSRLGGRCSGPQQVKKQLFESYHTFRIAVYELYDVVML